jgi:uncharacterized membrane protein
MLTIPRLAVSPRASLIAAILPIACAILLGGLAAPVSARPEFPEILKTLIKMKPGGNIDKASADCSLCHASGSAPSVSNLNPYGKDLRKALKATNSHTLTAAALNSTDNLDSDGDGFTNSAEFAADTLPGDPTSHPSGPGNAGPSTSAKAQAPPAAQPAESPSEGFWSYFHLRTLLFPNHAQHRVLVHFPIALFVVSLFLDALGFLRRKPEYEGAGYINLLIAAATGILSVISGFLAWKFAYGGVALSGGLLYHLVLGSVSTVLIIFLAAWRFREIRSGRSGVTVGYLILGLIGLALIGATGHIGGALVS